MSSLPASAEEQELEREQELQLEQVVVAGLNRLRSHSAEVIGKGVGSGQSTLETPSFHPRICSKPLMACFAPPFDRGQNHPSVSVASRCSRLSADVRSSA